MLSAWNRLALTQRKCIWLHSHTLKPWNIKGWHSCRKRIQFLIKTLFLPCWPSNTKCLLWMQSQSLCKYAKELLSVHKHYSQLMLSVECGSILLSQETLSWLWPTLLPWRPALARSKAWAPKTPRTLSKLSERSVSSFSFNTSFSPALLTPHLLSFDNMYICVLFVQIPYLGFCACEEMGETGVWQLVDPPILPLTHGPNHSFNWREMLMQDWRICCLALCFLAALNCWRSIYF